MNSKAEKYKNELKRLEGMFGLTFSDKERDKIVKIKIKKEQKGAKNVK